MLLFLLHIFCSICILIGCLLVLLITQHLFQEIIVEVVLGVHAGGVKIKIFFIQML